MYVTAPLLRGVNADFVGLLYFLNLNLKKLVAAQFNEMLRIRIGDPGSGIRCLFGPWIWDPGWVKSQDLDPG